MMPRSGAREHSRARVEALLVRQVEGAKAMANLVMLEEMIYEPQT